MAIEGDDDSGFSTPIQSYIKYFNRVKPYHTKILEVLEQYRFGDKVKASILERVDVKITLITPTETAPPTATPIITATITPTPIITATVTPTPTITPPGTPAVTVTPTATPPGTPAVTVTPTPTITPTPTWVIAAADGFVAGGNESMNVQAFPFASPFTTAGQIGSLVAGTQVFAVAGASDTGGGQGHTMGGYLNGVNQSYVLRFPFSAQFSVATDIGDLENGSGPSPQYNLRGAQSATDGFAGLGFSETTPSTFVFHGEIFSFPFASPFTGDRLVGEVGAGTRGNVASSNSSTTGYFISGSDNTPTDTTEINNFPFSSPFTLSNSVGDLSEVTNFAGGTQSSTDGYVGSGAPTNPVDFSRSTTIRSFPFAGPFGTASDIGDLGGGGRRYAAGIGGSGDGYFAGGSNGVTDADNIRIDKFPFSSPFTFSTDVGDLTANARLVSGAGLQS